MQEKLGGKLLILGHICLLDFSKEKVFWTCPIRRQSWGEPRTHWKRSLLALERLKIQLEELTESGLSEKVCPLTSDPCEEPCQCCQQEQGSMRLWPCSRLS
ncbi:hypothetical protein WMY93_002319 [Mugilogobius chulae]|uniref:Uncharacterized protein n=1 Tax=Mugilogobius chulae TaxID=88201 RepID=A0AAW0PTI7_9GOBI